jgi:hypothetical protein
MRKVIFSVLLSGVLCAPLFAANPVDRREHNQKTRIRQGVKSGELTRNETQRLLKEQARIRALERKVKSDHEITRKEVKKLDRVLDKAGKDIRKQKHDNQDRN